MNFSEWLEQKLLNEFKVSKINLPKTYGNQQVVVLTNLTKEEFMQKLKNTGFLRGFIYEGIDYWWDGSTAVHYAVAEGLGFGNSDQLQDMSFNQYCYNARLEPDNRVKWTPNWKIPEKFATPVF